MRAGNPSSVLSILALSAAGQTGNLLGGIEPGSAPEWHFDSGKQRGLAARRVGRGVGVGLAPTRTDVGPKRVVSYPPKTTRVGRTTGRAPARGAPTRGMTCRAGSLYPLVILASPVLQPPSKRHSWTRSGPAARWIAPSTPPPPSSEEFAALTIASTSRVVISARSAFISKLTLVARLGGLLEGFSECSMEDLGFLRFSFWVACRGVQSAIVTGVRTGLWRGSPTRMPAFWGNLAVIIRRVLPKAADNRRSPKAPSARA